MSTMHNICIGSTTLKCVYSDEGVQIADLQIDHRINTLSSLDRQLIVSIY
jgi:hypothetical protein